MTPDKVDQVDAPPAAERDDAPQGATHERTPPPRVQEAHPRWHDAEIDGDIDDDGWCSW